MRALIAILALILTQGCANRLSSALSSGYSPTQWAQNIVERSAARPSSGGRSGGILGSAANDEKTITAEHHENICTLFADHPEWHAYALISEQKWGIPVHVNMAMMKQESGFKANARPSRATMTSTWGSYAQPSSAFGFAQAKTGTWQDYQKRTGLMRARRNVFSDAVDFMGWYNHTSHTRLNVAVDNTYALYLAYHEGHGGYERKNYHKKPWLLEIAKNVHAQSRTYQQQLATCPVSAEHLQTASARRNAIMAAGDKNAPQHGGTSTQPASVRRERTSPMATPAQSSASCSTVFSIPVCGPLSALGS